MCPKTLFMGKKKKKTENFFFEGKSRRPLLARAALNRLKADSC